METDPAERTDEQHQLDVSFVDKTVDLLGIFTLSRFNFAFKAPLLTLQQMNLNSSPRST